MVGERRLRAGAIDGQERAELRAYRNRALVVTSAFTLLIPGLVLAATHG